MPLVTVVMGSKSDMPYMQTAVDILADLGIEHEVLIVSAHRNPERVRELGLNLRQRGIEVVIAGAGAAAHLPGVIAAWTTVPVIGVPLPTSDLDGLDSLYSIVQMPAGIPVATMAIGKAGAANAAYLAAQMLGIKFEHIRQAYERHRAQLAQPSPNA